MNFLAENCRPETEGFPPVVRTRSGRGLQGRDRPAAGAVKSQGRPEWRRGPGGHRRGQAGLPSKGDLGLDWDPVELAQILPGEWRGGDFGPDGTPLFQRRPGVHPPDASGDSPPILRKDFILEPIQVYESAALGADALLLIVSLLELGKLRALLLLTRSLGLAALVEVHTAAEMETASDRRGPGDRHQLPESEHLRDVSGPGPGTGPPGA